MTCAIAHADNGRVLLDAVREVRPPFSPDTVVCDLAALLETYGISHVHGDRYAGAWVREPFMKRGITYEPAERSKSELYRDLLPALNSGRVELLDHRRLRAELIALERRTARGGRDTVDHPPGGQDDVVNAAAGALIAASATSNAMSEDDRMKCLTAGRKPARDEELAGASIDEWIEEFEPYGSRSGGKVGVW